MADSFLGTDPCYNVTKPCHSTVGGTVTLIDELLIRLETKNLYELDMESVNSGTPLKCF